jgi:hypothetical protein
VYDDGVGFTFLAEPEASAMALNDEGSVIGHLDSGFGWINMRVWYADGGVDNFVLPRERTQPISVTGMNRHGEVVGTHVRPDPETDRSRWGGWIWTEATGLNEIPFLHRDDEGGNTVYIFGISDDGWVFGNEPYKPDGGERIGDYFLWHPESGFWHLADLYDWESQFTGVGDQNGNAAINANGWLTLENYVVGEHLARSIILVPNE